MAAQSVDAFSTPKPWDQITIPVRSLREYDGGKTEVFGTDLVTQVLFGFPSEFPMHMLTNWRVYRPLAPISSNDDGSVMSQIWTEHCAPGNGARPDRDTLHETDIGINVSSVVFDEQGLFRYRHDKLRGTVTRTWYGGSYELSIPPISCGPVPGSGSSVPTGLCSRPTVSRMSDWYPYAFGWGPKGDGEARSRGDTVQEWQPEEWREAYLTIAVLPMRGAELTLLVPAVDVASGAASGETGTGMRGRERAIWEVDGDMGADERRTGV